MFIETRKVSALATLIVAAGFATVVHAGTVYPTDEASYARWRVDAAFQVVAAMPQVAPVSVPMAMKGDLPVPLGCEGAAGDAQAECMDVAYEPDALPSMVVETTSGTTTTLMRMDAMAIAGVATQPAESAE